MLEDSEHPEHLPTLFTVIDRWRGEVAKTAAQFAVNLPECSRLTPHIVQPRYQTRLQARISTQHSPPIHATSTLQSKKRQAPQQLLTAPSSKRQAMPGRSRGRGRGDEARQGEQNIAQTVKRGRGRPPTQQVQQELAMMHLPPLLSTPSESSSRPTPSFRPSSPRKQSVKAINQERSAKTVDLDTLSTCDPALLPLSSFAARRQGHLPPAVHHLFKQLQSLPPGLVPSELKVRSFLLLLQQPTNKNQAKYDADADTPMKSRDPLHTSHFLPIGDTPFPAQALEHMRERVTRVVDDAAWNHQNNVHERQWGKLASQLIGELEMLPYASDFRFMNMYQDVTDFIVMLANPNHSETCAINPDEMRPRLPDDTPLVLEPSFDEKSSTYSSKEPQTVGKMVDWTFGLKLTVKETELVNKAFASGMYQNECTLNQTCQYPRLHPLFLDVEIKTTNSQDNPAVQLAIWKLAGLRKMKHHGWDATMPTLAIAITAHVWEYYIFFAVDSRAKRLVRCITNWPPLSGVKGP